MSILIVLASDANLTAHGWATRLAGFADAYDLFKDEGVELTLASSAGGWPWPELSTRDPEVTGSLARFGRTAREEFADTLSLDQVCVDDFEGAYCVGLPGPIWRSAMRVDSLEAVLARFLESGKPIAVVPSNLDVSPRGAGKGLLITGEAETSAILTAQTLLAAARARAASRKSA